MDDVTVELNKNPTASEMGKVGGCANGARKRRPRAHYVKASNKRWREHKLKIKGDIFPPLAG